MVEGKLRMKCSHLLKVATRDGWECERCGLGWHLCRPERVIATLMKNQKERDEKNRRLLAKFQTFYSMNETELREAMKTRPALVKIDAILGKNATPDQKMELFRLLQGYMEQAIQRTIRDLTPRRLRSSKLDAPPG